MLLTWLFNPPVAGTEMSDAPMDRQKTGSHRLDVAAQEWTLTDLPGFLIKPIFEDKKTGERTLLMKIEPGAFASAHCHDQLEEIVILEGTFYDDEHVYKPGQYCQRAVGALHTAGSQEGCVVLLIYRRE